MNRSRIWIACMVVSTTSALWGQDDIPVEPPALPAEASDADLDVLTRGPIHEAFAEQISPDPQPGMVAPKAPPEPINEVPPDMKPEGDDVAWIPGYWFWDDERNDYLWVSGVWRRVPPQRRWVPGYWQAAEAGYQWVAGLWSPVSDADVEYLDLPPESLESGPSSPSPSDDYFWIPGTWVWNVSRYQWQPGSWCSYRDGWTWVSTRYIWTPRGCIYVPGYWDYTLTQRGHLFAPVYYRSPIYRRAGYFYRPVCWIGYEPLLLHLFVRPHCHHLYFGDYYSPIYRQRHFIPGYSYHAAHLGCVSLYVYYQHHYRHHGIDYLGRVRDWHGYYARHGERRPAHTFREQNVRQRVPGIERKFFQDILARPYGGRESDRVAGRQLVRVPTETRQRYRRESEQLRELGTQRRRFELDGDAGRTVARRRDSGPGRESARWRLPPSTMPVTKSESPPPRRSVRPSQNVVRTVDRNRSPRPTVRGQNGVEGGELRRALTGSDAGRRSGSADPASRRGGELSRGTADQLDASRRSRMRPDRVSGENARRLDPSLPGEQSLREASRRRRTTPSTIADSTATGRVQAPRVNRPRLPFASDAAGRGTSVGGPSVTPGSNSSPAAGLPSRSAQADNGRQMRRSTPTRMPPELSRRLSELAQRAERSRGAPPTASQATAPASRFRRAEVKMPDIQPRSRVTRRPTTAPPASAVNRLNTSGNQRSALRSRAPDAAARAPAVRTPRAPAVRTPRAPAAATRGSSPPTSLRSAPRVTRGSASPAAGRSTGRARVRGGATSSGSAAPRGRGSSGRGR